MKKIVLLAAFGVAGLVSAKSSITKDVNESKVSSTVSVNYSFENKQLCGVYVTFYNESGQVTGSHFYSSDQSSYSDCQNYQAGVRRMLLQMGLIIEEQGPI